MTGGTRPGRRPGSLRRRVLWRHPVGVLAVVLAAVLAATAAPAQVAGAPSFLAMMAATYWVARHASARSAVPGLAAALLVTGVAQVLASPGSPHASAITFFAILLVIAPAAIGAVVRARAGLAGQLQQAASRLRAARDGRISAVVAGERQRTIGELDRVMLCGLDGLRRHAAAADRAEVAQVERIARETLAEMRELLVRFRGGQDAGPAGAEGPGEGQPPVPSLPEVRARVMAALAADPAPPPAQASAAMRLTLPSRRHIDAVLALLALGLAGLLAATRAWPTSALAGIAIMVPVAFLRRAPLPAAAVSLAATICYSITARPDDPLAGVTPVAAMVLVPLVAGAVCPWIRALGILCACLAVIALAVVADPAATFSPASVAGAVVVTLASWSAGRFVQDGSRMLAALAQATAQAREEEAAGVRQAIGEERLRIARELHDAVGHAMTSILMQATAARRAWDADPDRAAGHVAALRATTSQVAEELHTLVVSGVVATQGPPAGADGVAALRALAEQAWHRGLPVLLEVEGMEAPLSPAASQAAYRIMQEAITNAARHAPGARVQVTARFDAEGLALEVTNQPPAWPALAATGAGGHGLPGMHERAAACGGMVEAGPRPDGCFTVLARLPASTRVVMS